MSTTTHQGAEGAETMTAGPGDLLYRSEWETTRTIAHEEAYEIARRLIASHFHRTDCETARASIPANPDRDDDLLINSYIKQQARKEATPAPRTDGGMTAGVLWSAWPEDDCDSDPRIDPMAQKVTEWFVGRWPIGADEPECRILIGEGRSAEIIARRLAEKLTSVLNTDAIRAALAAQGEGTVAVPLDPTDGMQEDGLAALEVAIRTHGKPSLPGFAAAHVYRAMLAARPATSSATPAQPAGAVPDGLRALSDIQFHMDDCDAGFAKVPRQRLAEWKALLSTHPAGQSAGSGAETQPCERCQGNGEIVTDWGRYLHGEPGDVGDEGTADCPDCGGIGEIDTPAPDSTRTGDEGAEETAGLMSQVSTDHIAAFDDIARDLTNLYAPDGPPALRQGILAALLRVHLAAHPAAPEAQGAWQPIETAPPNKAVQVYVPNHDYYGNEGVYAGMLVDMGTGQRWMTFAWAMGRDMCGDSRPTHWRPLPAPPSSGQGGR